MCAIVGQVGPIGDPAQAAALLDRQLALLRHRGPDDQGILVDSDFAFGHARLAIIDPEQGAQPFLSADGNLVITYNGEIYNYIELREELRSLGASFRTASDTEVLLEGYRHWGESVLLRLDGMFAFAIYDRRKRELFCARDPYGQKPFFWMQHQERFHFASECRALVCVNGFDAAVDLASVADFLAFECLPFDRSIYHDVDKLPPGHALMLRDGQARVWPYFESLPDDGRHWDATRQPAEVAAALLRRSVERTFRADVPVGLLLSGGLDSSLVLALLREVHPAAPLRTYTVRNVDPTFDESGAADLLSREFATDHTVVTAYPASLARCAAALPALLDEPQADPGILPKYLVCAQIARDCKVALTGDGGDELFYGYAIFRAQRIARFARRLPDVLHRGVIGPLARLLRARDGYMGIDLRAKQFAKGFPAPDALRNFYWTCAFSDRELPRLLRESRCDLRDVEAQLARLSGAWSRASGPLGRLAYQYQQQYLPDYVLANSDRASMLNSVELRTPFLSPDLAAFANALPDRVKMAGGRTKAVLRDVAARRLPDAILRRPKMGFTSPVAALIKGAAAEEIREYLGPALLARTGLFNPTYAGRIVGEHFAGRHNHYKPIWVMYMLQKWMLARGLPLR